MGVERVGGLGGAGGEATIHFRRGPRISCYTTGEHHVQQCVICHKCFGDKDSALKAVNVVGGRSKLSECSIRRGDKWLTDLLAGDPTHIKVHEQCRRSYQYVPIASKRFAEVEDEPSKYMRSSAPAFDRSTTCVLCGKLAVDKKHPNKKGVRSAKSDDVNDNILKTCWDRSMVFRNHWSTDL